MGSNRRMGGVWRWLIWMLPLVSGAALVHANDVQTAAEKAARQAGFVAQLNIDGPIGPAAAEYYHDASQRALADGARAIILKINTPGGLSSSMQEIVSDILASPAPVLGYVAPDGARAASAGTYILYACHIAAMAPATHLGAATPVSIGGETPMPSPLPQHAAPSAKQAAKTPVKNAPQEKSSKGDAEDHKVLNDAIAYIRSLAQLRHRNAEWAMEAVRGAATLTADEAAKQNVINFVADNDTALLKQADGMKVDIDGQSVTLHVAGLSVRDYQPNWRTQFLSIITNPTIAYVLLLAGIWGLVLEAFHPGAMLPGIVGGICLLTGAYAMQLLPVNYAGFALMVLGIGLMVGEVLTPTVGALGLGGVAAFIIGSIMLMNTGIPGYEVNLGIILGVATFVSLLLLLVLTLVMRSRRRRVVTGSDELASAKGQISVAIESPDGLGWAQVHGERWQVRSDQPIAVGAKIQVVRRDGLLLWVKPL